ncbi:MAG: hypothetical protein MZU97_04915 [Bacillus subtilis]|nr:hypothetical protein [Bacillus subtilis]
MTFLTGYYGCGKTGDRRQSGDPDESRRIWSTSTSSIRISAAVSRMLILEAHGVPRDLERRSRTRNTPTCPTSAARSILPFLDPIDQGGLRSRRQRPRSQACFGSFAIIWMKPTDRSASSSSIPTGWRRPPPDQIAIVGPQDRRPPGASR